MHDTDSPYSANGNHFAFEAAVLKMEQTSFGKEVKEILPDSVHVLLEEPFDVEIVPDNEADCDDVMLTPSDADFGGGWQCSSYWLNSKSIIVPKAVDTSNASTQMMAPTAAFVDPKRLQDWIDDLDGTAHDAEILPDDPDQVVKTPEDYCFRHHKNCNTTKKEVPAINVGSIIAARECPNSDWHQYHVSSIVNVGNETIINNTRWHEVVVVPDARLVTFGEPIPLTEATEARLSELHDEELSADFDPPPRSYTHRWAQTDTESVKNIASPSTRASLLLGGYIRQNIQEDCNTNTDNGNKKTCSCVQTDPIIIQPDLRVEYDFNAASRLKFVPSYSSCVDAEIPVDGFDDALDAYRANNPPAKEASESSSSCSSSSRSSSTSASSSFSRSSSTNSS
eukprot:TRINITY_DN655_c0_g3_i5.p1 TRINITY_DN655_c0_g3~~TRINITY_DN655_c0_g3_i5.p1  ORF type:complete len:405 (+),score=71.46 TRINITY_DN655_c0_g3_i5:32-1216(+)